MTKPAIEAVGLSKRYSIGAVKQQNLTLQERLAQTVAKPFKRIGGLLRGHAAAAADLSESFWALQDVSFSIEPGEVVGIIGHNGAGKSTLLKLLSRITEPTSGHATVRGRVGSLLEVGTGFHPELTGRENVFLNGSILGMRESEVRAKFDDIVEFAEVEKFIDTPTKHYSSGMRVRLAFAVAAHLNPEVMFVDEVLAVGDAAFRKKCADKIEEVVRSGATVLIVSHNAQAITSMCERVLWLDGGRLVADGPAAETVVRYLSRTISLSGEKIWLPNERPGGDIARIHAMRIVNKSGQTANHIDVRDPFYVETELEVCQPGYGILLKHDIFSGDNSPVFSALDVNNPTWQQQTWAPGEYRLRMAVPGNFLQVENYPIGAVLWAWEPEQVLQWYDHNVLCVQIIDGGEGQTAKMGFTGLMQGPLRPVLDWHVEPLHAAQQLPRSVQGNGVGGGNTATR